MVLLLGTVTLTMAGCVRKFSGPHAGFEVPVTVGVTVPTKIGALPPWVVRFPTMLSGMVEPGSRSEISEVCVMRTLVDPEVVAALPEPVPVAVQYATAETPRLSDKRAAVIPAADFLVNVLFLWPITGRDLSSMTASTSEQIPG